MRFARREEREPTVRYLTPGVRHQLAAIVFQQNDWLAPIAVWVAALLLTMLGQPTMDSQSLYIWFAAASIHAGSMLVVNHIPALHRRVDRNGTPVTANAYGFTGGLLFASYLWVDTDALAETELRLTVFCILLAITAGSVGGIAGIAGHGRYIVYPLWISAAAALLFHGETTLALAAVFFVLVLAKDLGETNNLLAELLYHREQADGRATAAQDEALRDPLTNLLNRAGLLAATGGGSFGGDSQVTAMFIDLDHFKMVNDRFGHGMGDHVLVEVADRLASTVRPADIVARLGGDEFLVLVDAPLDRAQRERLAQSIITAIELPFVTDKHEARISASIGITVVPARDFDLDSVQRESDHALYVAKGLGRRRSAHFDEAVRSGLEQRNRLETELRTAFEGGDIEAWGQPIVELETGNVAVVELLARWRRDDGAYCPPNVFVPIAEELGLLDVLAGHMLEQAVATLTSWESHPTLSTASISINVSPRQLADPVFVDRICSGALSDRVPLERLILEITESADLQIIADIDVILGRLVESGIRLALDDFGSGHTSVTHLLGLPIEYVKLDGSLIEELGHDARQSALVRSIADLAVTIGKQIVAEGVETEHQVAQLRALGLPLAQGYHFGRAQPLPRFTAAPIHDR